jgi:PAS domain S-box-containing protein
MEQTPTYATIDTASQVAGDRVRPALLSAIVDSAMDAIVALDDEQRIVLFNPSAEAMFGCPAVEALGQPLDRFLPERFRAIHRQHVAAFGETGDTARSMGHLRPLAALRANGDEFPIEATISQVVVDGRPHFAAIVRDISARRAAETRLQRQADLLDLANDAIFTWDWDGPITFWNRGAERLYQRSSQDAIGRSVHELLRVRHPDGVDALRHALERDGVWEGELRQIRGDGSDIVVESRRVLVRETSRPYVLEVCRDVTERKRAEAERIAGEAQEAASRAAAEAAALQRDRLREILDGLPSGVFIMASDRRLELANASFVDLVYGGRPPSAMLPIYDRDFTLLRADGAPLPLDERPAVRALRGERVRNSQLLLERAGGERLPVTVHAAPMREDADLSARAIVVMEDVTQLRQAEQLKDDFLALISHEFRTPLTAIHGGARLLESGADVLDAQTRQEVLGDVVAESARLDRMLGNILTLANVMAGRLPVVTEPVLLTPLAQTVVHEVQPRSPSHAFAVAVPPDLPAVEADPDLLEQVLRNLFENAVKYSPAGGEIRVTATWDTEGIALHVADQGIGIAPEHVGSVFERFRRVGGDPTVRGMGLGLYLSRHLVEAQGGRIAASSPGLGLGTVFTVTLPVARGWADPQLDADYR